MLVSHPVLMRVTTTLYEPKQPLTIKQLRDLLELNSGIPELHSSFKIKKDEYI